MYVLKDMQTHKNTAGTKEKQSKRVSEHRAQGNLLGQQFSCGLMGRRCLRRSQHSPHYLQSFPQTSSKALRQACFLTLVQHRGASQIVVWSIPCIFSRFETLRGNICSLKCLQWSKGLLKSVERVASSFCSHSLFHWISQHHPDALVVKRPPREREFQERNPAFPSLVIRVTSKSAL